MVSVLTYSIFGLRIHTKFEAFNRDVI